MPEKQGWQNEFIQYAWDWSNKLQSFRAQLHTVHHVLSVEQILASYVYGLNWNRVCAPDDKWSFSLIARNSVPSKHFACTQCSWNIPANNPALYEWCCGWMSALQAVKWNVPMQAMDPTNTQFQLRCSSCNLRLTSSDQIKFPALIDLRTTGRRNLGWNKHGGDVNGGLFCFTHCLLHRCQGRTDDCWTQPILFRIHRSSAHFAAITPGQHISKRYSICMASLTRPVCAYRSNGLCACRNNMLWL